MAWLRQNIMHKSGKSNILGIDKVMVHPHIELLSVDEKEQMRNEVCDSKKPCLRYVAFGNLMLSLKSNATMLDGDSPHAI